MKQYLCYWDGNYPKKIETHDQAWFNVDRGYEPEAFNKIWKLEICELCDLSDMSGTHFVIRILDVGDNRTQALYNAWRAGRIYVDNLQKMFPGDDINAIPGYIYPDKSWIESHGNYFATTAYSAEFEHSYLNEVEKWLWNNYVRFNKEAGEV